MITKLSKRQKELIPVFFRKWRDSFFSLKFDEARAWTFGMSKEEYFRGSLKFRQGDVLIVYEKEEGGLKSET